MTQSIATSWWHKTVRTGAVVVAVVLVAVSGIVSDMSAQLSGQAFSHVASSIGVTVGVAPTELNQITARLTEKEQQLAAREAAIRDREIAVGISGEAAANQRLVYILSSVLFILLLLILLNYVLDYLRWRRMRDAATMRFAPMDELLTN